ncbi:MAG TPA: tripartite tricarboxylate transporter permease, partial [Beijerinckiaceae bacterium]|nr:tripartite tricarboxylate transporter permease [Beijerinckiaceae bacterium]
EMFSYLAQALTPFNLGLALAGVVVGTIIGALPGLSATMAVAVLVPFTFGMNPASGLITLGAIYTGAIYGGAYSAILVNTPGTPSAIATTFDGFPMARRGDGNLAVTLATLGSVVGGVIGALFLLFLSPPLSGVALAFGPPEYFWLAVLGLTLISALSVGNLLKGLIGACFGLFLATMGQAVVGGDTRFTFDSPLLLGGINVIAALIGLYCVPVIIDLVATPDPHLRVKPQAGGYRLGEAVALCRRGWFNLMRGSTIGTLVGILPGAGGSIASLVAYSEARRSSKTPERFGQGEPDGILATESANNATVGGGFIPTLVLGIPGTPPDAVILGALLVQGIRTGPGLFTGQGDIVYTFIFGLLIATLLMLPAGLLIGRYAYQAIVAVPKAVLVPSVAFLTVIGSFAIHNNADDVVIMFALGVLGWILNRFGYSPSPIVLGVILGPIAEQGFVQAWLIGSAQNDLFGMFFLRPISGAIALLAIAGIVWPLFADWRRRRRPAEPALGTGTPNVEPAAPQVTPAVTGGPVTRSVASRDLGGVAIAGLFILLGLWMEWESVGMSALGSVFPRTIATAMIVCAIALIVRQLLRPRVREVPVGESTPRRVALIAVMAVWVLLLPIVGFFATSFAAFLILLAVANYDGWTPRRTLGYGLTAIGVIALFYVIFVRLLLVPAPRGWLI